MCHKSRICDLCQPSNQLCLVSCHKRLMTLFCALLYTWKNSCEPSIVLVEEIPFHKIHIWYVFELHCPLDLWNLDFFKFSVCCGGFLVSKLYVDTEILVSVFLLLVIFEFSITKTFSQKTVQCTMNFPQIWKYLLYH